MANWWLLLCIALVFGAACGEDDKQETTVAEQAQIVTTASGLQYQDLAAGSGEAVTTGKTVSMHYTGWLSEGGNPGAKFDSSLDRGQPFTFRLGGKQVIAGWDEGIVGMKKGGKRRLIIPANLAYGAAGRPPVIPQNADLIFDTELVDFR